MPLILHPTCWPRPILLSHQEHTSWATFDGFAALRAAFGSLSPQVTQRAGSIDVLVDNAGYDLYGSLENTSFEESYDQVDTNSLGVVRMTKALLPLMRIRGRGRIVSICSLGGRVGLPLNGAYAASKFALEGLMESLRLR